MYENCYLCHSMTDPGNSVVTDASKVAGMWSDSMYENCYLCHSMTDPCNSVVTDASKVAGMWSDRYILELLPMSQYDRPL